MFTSLALLMMNPLSLIVSSYRYIIDTLYSLGNMLLTRDVSKGTLRRSALRALCKKALSPLTLTLVALPLLVTVKVKRALPVIPRLCAMRGLEPLFALILALTILPKLRMALLLLRCFLCEVELCLVLLARRLCTLFFLDLECFVFGLIFLLLFRDRFFLSLFLTILSSRVFFALIVSVFFGLVGVTVDLRDVVTLLCCVGSIVGLTIGLSGMSTLFCCVGLVVVL